MLSANKRMSSFEPPNQYTASKKARPTYTPGRKPFGDLENKQHVHAGELYEGSSSVFGDLFSGLKGYPPVKSSPQALPATTGISPLSPTEHVNIDLQHSQLVLRKRTQRAERCAVAAARARALAIDVASPEERRGFTPSLKTKFSDTSPKSNSEDVPTNKPVFEKRSTAIASTFSHRSTCQEPQPEVAAVIPATPHATGLKRKVSKKAQRKHASKNQQPLLPHAAFQTPATRLQRLEAAHAANLKVHVGVVATPGWELVPAPKFAAPRTAPSARSSSFRLSPAAPDQKKGVTSSESATRRERALDLRWAAWLLRTNRIEPAAQLGHPEAMATLAERLLLGRGQGSHHHHGDDGSHTSSPATPEPLAVILGQGTVNDDNEDGGEADPETAVDWAMKSAAAGDKGGQRLLGLAYRHGLGGLSVNFKLASEQFEAASVQGCGSSMAHLAWLLTVGSPSLRKVTTPWSSLAARLATAARPNDCNDDTYLAPSPHRAFWWYLQAAQSKNTRPKSRAAAAKAVSQCYANGFGVTRDLEAAEEWAQKAAVAS